MGKGMGVGCAHMRCVMWCRGERMEGLGCHCPHCQAAQSKDAAGEGLAAGLGVPRGAAGHCGATPAATPQACRLGGGASASFSLTPSQLASIHVPLLPSFITFKNRCWLESLKATQSHALPQPTDASVCHVAHRIWHVPLTHQAQRRACGCSGPCAQQQHHMVVPPVRGTGEGDKGDKP